MLTWNPERWDWDEFDREDEVELTRSGVEVEARWSTGSRSSGIQPGDRAFLLQQGRGERGLVGSGWFTSECFTDESWADPHRDANYAALSWDRLLTSDELLPTEDLQAAIPDFPWNNLMGSGVHVPDDQAQVLEEMWANHTSSDSADDVPAPPLRDDDERPLYWGRLRLRQGQTAFRAALMRAYQGCCAVTGCSQSEVLQAAHISPYRGKHTNRLDNGLLLRADVHNLFDAGLLAVADDGRVLVSSLVTDPAYRAQVDGRPLRRPANKADRPSTKLLAQHRKNLRP